MVIIQENKMIEFDLLPIGETFEIHRKYEEKTYWLKISYNQAYCFNSTKIEVFRYDDLITPKNAKIIFS